MDNVTTQFVDVPGGRLAYQVRGNGPLLLVIGQPMTKEPFGPVADVLAADHTVVTYDPHGLGESTIDDPSLDVTPDVEADDLAALIDAVGGGPADVFGSSGGGVAALALATRHPGKVRTVIAHEPPITELLPDAAHIRAAVDGVEAAYRGGGAGAGWGAFVSMVMHQGPMTEAGPAPAGWPPPGAGGDDDAHTEGAAPPEPSPKQQADDELFFLRMLKPFTLFVPELEALKGGTPRVVVAVGEASHGEIASRAAESLAERLGVPAARFPGDHGGFMADPAAFADAIRAHL